MGQEEEDLKDYYSSRSGEYDRLYEKPDRQADLAGMRNALIEKLSGRRILEIACGTGYWTEILADYADSILAIDSSTEMIEIARKRTESRANVSFLVSDAYSMDNVGGSFDGALCGYWISHVKERMIKKFLDTIHGKLESGSVVVMIDNRYVESATPISRTDGEGNTYQIRKLKNGQEYEIVKNFLTEGELLELTSGTAYDRNFLEFEYYWVFQYTI